MSGYVGINPFVISFHLLKTCAVWIMHKIESVASWCPMPKNQISFIVFKNKVQIEILTILRIFRNRPMQILISILNRNSQLIEFRRLGRYKNFALLFLCSLSKNTWVTTKFICVVDCLQIIQLLEKDLENLFRVLNYMKNWTYRNSFSICPLWKIV